MNECQVISWGGQWGPEPKGHRSWGVLGVAGKGSKLETGAATSEFQNYHSGGLVGSKPTGQSGWEAVGSSLGKRGRGLGRGEVWGGSSQWSLEPGGRAIRACA